MLWGTIPFDTLADTKKLKEAGFTMRQAEVQAKAMAALINDQLATRHDFNELEISVKRDLNRT